MVHIAADLPQSSETSVRAKERTGYRESALREAAAWGDAEYPKRYYRIHKAVAQT
jgi:hypothetical protein